MMQPELNLLTMAVEPKFLISKSPVKTTWEEIKSIGMGLKVTSKVTVTVGFTAGLHLKEVLDLGLSYEKATEETHEYSAENLAKGERRIFTQKVLSGSVTYKVLADGDVHKNLKKDPTGIAEGLFTVWGWFNPALKQTVEMADDITAMTKGEFVTKTENWEIRTDSFTSKDVKNPEIVTEL